MLDVSQISSIDLSITDLVMLVFFFLIGTYAIFSAILIYHWQAYSSNLKVTSLTLTLFFTATVPLLAVLTVVALKI